LSFSLKMAETRKADEQASRCCARQRHSSVRSLRRYKWSTIKPLIPKNKSVTIPDLAPRFSHNHDPVPFYVRESLMDPAWPPDLNFIRMIGFPQAKMNVLLRAKPSFSRGHEGD